jgi:hypothetical protein
MAMAISKALNGDKPIEAHTVGFAIVTFMLGPNQPAHYSSNVDPVSLANTLKGIIADLERRMNPVVQTAPQTLIVPPRMQ